jgi:hypothetical protein
MPGEGEIGRLQLIDAFISNTPSTTCTRPPACRYVHAQIPRVPGALASISEFSSSSHSMRRRQRSNPLSTALFGSGVCSLPQPKLLVGITRHQNI